jgi:hypothetical protein
MLLTPLLLLHVAVPRQNPTCADQDGSDSTATVAVSCTGIFENKAGFANIVIPTGTTDKQALCCKRVSSVQAMLAILQNSAVH